MLILIELEFLIPFFSFLLLYSRITDLQNTYLRSAISLNKYHDELCNLYHGYEKNLPQESREQDVLQEVVQDEVDLAVLPPAPGVAPAPAPPPRQDEEAWPHNDDDFEGFVPLDGWDELDLSDDELLTQPDLEDQVAEQAEEAARHQNQEVPICIVCFAEMTNKHVSSCGHFACLACWTGAKVPVPFNGNPNADELPKCPYCSQGIRILIKVFEETTVARHVLMEEEERFQAFARRDLNGGGNFNNFNTNFFSNRNDK